MLDVASDVSKKIDDVPNIKIGHIDDIKNDKNILHVPENRKALNEFFEKQDLKFVEELSEELAEDVDLKKIAISDPHKFILEKKLEQAVSEKITKELAEGGEEILQKISQKAGVSITELKGMKHLSQL